MYNFSLFMLTFPFRLTSSDDVSDLPANRVYGAISDNQRTVPVTSR